MPKGRNINKTDNVGADCSHLQSCILNGAQIASQPPNLTTSAMLRIHSHAGMRTAIEANQILGIDFLFKRNFTDLRHLI